MTPNNKKSLDLHKKYHGKMEIKSKVRINNAKDLCLVYTPGVGEVSRAIAKNPGLAKDYTIIGNSVAIVTDGSAVLGLGNIGPLAALPVMEGKAILYKRFSGIDAFPLCLDTQNIQEIITTIKNIAPVFGAIHLEDISAPRCFEIEKRLQQQLTIPVLHDDQHCTAVVVLAALINALKVTGGSKKIKIVLNGAGAAGVGIARLLLAYGFKNLIILDSKGALYAGRKKLDGEKLKLAKLTNQKKVKGTLSDCLANAEVFIGVTKAGLLKPAMIKLMAPKSIIFALANPVPEIMPNVAKKAGAFIIATGRSDFPNQINNAMVFPGIFRGALNNNVRSITPTMLIKAAKNLSALVSKPSAKKILPDLFDKRIVPAIAKAITNS